METIAFDYAFSFSHIDYLQIFTIRNNPKVVHSYMTKILS